MTDFGKYIRAKKIPANAAARALEIKRAYVYMLSSGVATPGLALAGQIESWTKGKVTMRSWLKWI